MKMYGIVIPGEKGLTNLDLNEYARWLEIGNFRGVFMRDTLPKRPHEKECGIMNLNTSHQPGSHLVLLLQKWDEAKIIF